MDAGADVDARQGSAAGATSLYLAVGIKSASMVRRLLELGASPNVCNTNGLSPLHLAAALGNDVIVSSLLTSRASIKFQNSEKCSPMHFAGAFNHPRTIQILYDAVASVDCQDAILATPLHYASKHGARGAIQALLLCKANLHALDNSSRSIIHYSAIDTTKNQGQSTTDRAMKTLTMLLSLEWGYKDIGGFPLLENAVRRSTFELVNKLLLAGVCDDACVGALNSEGKTLVHIWIDRIHDRSLTRGHWSGFDAQFDDDLWSMLKTLLEHGASPNAHTQDGLGQTPLHLLLDLRRSALAAEYSPARSDHFCRALELLLMYGADPQALDAANQIPVLIWSDDADIKSWLKACKVHQWRTFELFGDKEGKILKERLRKLLQPCAAERP